ncbi:MAG: energy transducer TonB [Bacteroidales bacterium]|nr:energy transducer TonB [Bacteroidales bacterium]
MITVIFHLTVIIVLLLYQIDSTVRREESFVIDFSKQEEIERQIKEMEEMEKEIAKLDAIRQRLEEKISGTSTPVRNIAVDNSGPLKDDRGTDAEQLYKDAERLAQDLKNGQKSNAFEEKYSDDAVDLGGGGKKNNEKSDKAYSGPSVLSYTLDGRKASKLPIPAYRCYAGGEVTVIIVVNPQGAVIGAEVKDDISSTDQCLRSFAVRAARLSKFSQSSTAPARQTGEIVYRFIAQ